MKGCILPVMGCGPCPLLFTSLLLPPLFLPILFLPLLRLLLEDAGHSITPLLPCIAPDLADVKILSVLTKISFETK